MNYHEYNAVNTSAPCAHATLSTYNQTSGNNMNGNMGSPPMSSVASNVSGFYLVPNYQAPGYDALTHGGKGSSSGFFSITHAYGANADKCSTKYLRKICN
tara:strand:- start:1714 stop:2013 length:300 start_codon:yes stop_codon:yes gene_type:complete